MQSPAGCGRVRSRMCGRGNSDAAAQCSASTDSWCPHAVTRTRGVGAGRELAQIERRSVLDLVHAENRRLDASAPARRSPPPECRTYLTIRTGPISSGGPRQRNGSTAAATRRCKSSRCRPDAAQGRRARGHATAACRHGAEEEGPGAFGRLSAKGAARLQPNGTPWRQRVEPGGHETHPLRSVQRDRASDYSPREWSWA